MLAGGGIGLPLLVSAYRAGRRPETVAAAAFGMACLASTLTSRAPVLSLFGLYNWGTGTLFVLSLIGLWALGTAVPRRNQFVVLLALTGGLTITCALGVLQTFVTLPSLAGGSRSTGLAGSANHLATLAGALAGLSLFQLRRQVLWLAPLALASAAAQTSGSRSGLVIVLGALAFASFSLGWQRAVTAAGVIAFGIMVGSVAVSAGDGVSATARSATGGIAVAPGEGGLGIRAHVWRMASDSAFEAPVLGVGPGMFHSTSEHQRLEIARAEGPDVTYSDAHNLLVEYATTAGGLGLVSFIVWLVLTLRRGSGVMLAAVVPMLIASLVNPQSLSTTPLLFLLIGLAGARRRPFLPSRPVAGASAVFAIAGIVAGATIVVGDALLLRGVNDLDVHRLEQAERLLPWWSLPASVLAAYHDSADQEGVPGAGEAALRWRNRAVKRDPLDPQAWSALGYQFERAGRIRDAEKAYGRALELNPWSASALEGLAELARAEGDHAAARRLERRLHRVAPAPPTGRSG